MDKAEALSSQDQQSRLENLLENLNPESFPS